MSEVKTVFEIGQIKFLALKHDDGRILVSARIRTDDVEPLACDALAAATKAAVIAAQAVVDASLGQGGDDAA